MHLQLGLLVGWQWFIGHAIYHQQYVALHAKVHSFGMTE
jgi:hypothetical protein